MEQDLLVNDFLKQSEEGIIVDVRTPAEFKTGHITGAVNIPLFSDEERVIIGTLYKKQGKDIAVEKGLEFVGPKMASFVKEAKKRSQGKSIFIYCWRGGMRSGSMAWLFRTAGLQVKRLTGGYKAYRSSFLEEILTQPWQIRVLGGPTGCGKTDILHQLAAKGEQVLDIEGLANHKGSAFGALGQEDQPTTEQFVNLLHHEFRKFSTERTLWCEGESISIGRVYIPKELFELMQKAPFIYLNLPVEDRLNRLVHEYGQFSMEELTESFRKIERRLGGQHLKAAICYLQEGNIHEAARIGLHYYDKSYDRAINEKRNVACHLDAATDNPAETANLLLKLKL
ncbi:MAG: tRNA 2-selenouridine(34) synthase MnmH [Bacteroidales bacterium]